MQLARVRGSFCTIARAKKTRRDHPGAEMNTQMLRHPTKATVLPHRGGDNPFG